MRNAVLYARVSSKEQEQGFSIPAQLKLLQQYAQSHALTIVQEFAISESAKEAGRKHFAAMLAFLKENPNCRVVIVEKTDRLLRNLRDYVALDDLVEELPDLEVHLVKEGQVMRNREKAKSQDRLVQGMFALLARNYIDNMLEEIRKGQAVKAERGEYPGRAPLGYMHDHATRSIVVDPKKGAAITDAFQLYATGSYSVFSLRKTLLATTGLRVSKAHLHRLLQSRFYLGFFKWRGTEYHGIHPPLVDHSTFQRVQDVISGRNTNKCKPNKLRFPFSGLMTCICESGITTERHKGRYDYYHCTFSHGKHPFKYMRGEYVAERLGAVLKDIRMPQEFVDGIVNSIQTDYLAAEETRQEQVRRLTQQLAALRTRMERSYEDKLDGSIDEKFWSAKNNEWHAQEDELLVRLEALGQLSHCDPGLSARKILELAQHAHSLYLRQNDAERAQLLKIVLSNCKA
jgi:site-specific DNA recombinase